MSKYTPQTRKSTSPSQAIDDTKRRTSLLKDGSWIRKNDDEDEAVDRDPNFGKSILGRHKSSESLNSQEPEETKPTGTRTSTTSVHALTKRFGESQDDGKSSSTLPSSKTTSSKRITTSKTTIIEEPKKSTKTTKVTKDGKTTETTTTTTTQSVRSPVTKSPAKTETFTERVKSSSKGPQYTSYSPTSTTKVTEKTVSSPKEPEDKLFDTLIPSSIKDEYSPKDSKTTVTTTETVIVKSSPDTKAEKEVFDTLLPKSVKDDVKESKTTVSSTETVTVKTSKDGNGVKTTTTTRTSSAAEDDLYDTLLPKSITSGLSSPVSSSITRREVVTVESSRGGDSPTLTSPTSTRRSLSSYSSYDDIPSTRTTSYSVSTKPSDDYSSERKSYSYSRPDSSYEYTSVTSPSSYTSITSPTTYTTKSYRTSSRSEDYLSDPIYSKSSTKNSYTSSERTVHEKDLCTICRKTFTGDAKMVLDDMNIKCHASCFKCDVCNSTLGNLKAGDSLWIYKRMVHCENCFDTTREKWRR
ncbi:sciellin isoform X3 [Acanthochromis polyacanthus]|uniref:sciellin isoform X3 n=1 Tax=Acanthochromis polyacanthus TaxID=80966 RepID=UPI00223482E1|nr:sciellin isoform X3 [Acanthochromis polyacanthus]